MQPNPQESADFVAFINEILDEKLQELRPNVIATVSSLTILIILFLGR